MKVLSEEEIQNYLIIKVLIKSELYIMLNELNNVIKASSAELQWVVEKLMYIVCKT